MKKIKCKTKIMDGGNVRVRVIRAPIVNTKDLRCIIAARANAIII